MPATIVEIKPVSETVNLSVSEEDQIARDEKSSVLSSVYVPVTASCRELAISRLLMGVMAKLSSAIIVPCVLP